MNNKKFYIMGLKRWHQHSSTTCFEKPNGVNVYRTEMLAGGKHLAYNLAEHHSERQALDAVNQSKVNT
jgi:hypothetical protein